MKNRHLSFLLVPAKALVGNILATFKEFSCRTRERQASAYTR